MDPETQKLVLPLILVIGGILLRKSQRDSDKIYRIFGLLLIVVGAIVFTIQFINYVR